MAVPARDWRAWEVELHGHRVLYRTAGSGPPVVLVHGMVNSSRHWREVALALAGSHTVIAPDLIGHGDSATPRGDYSLGAHAAVIRDVLAVVGVQRATFVGHSLGGGVVMQFYWQFPEQVERLALVSSGGLGREVSGLLRTAALPGVSALLAAGAHPAVLRALWGTGGLLRRLGARGGVHLQAIARALRPLERREAREAFLHTLRAVIDVRGQRVSAQDRLYLLAEIPTLIVWGERDGTIPLAHGREAHAAIEGSRLVTLPGVAHFPHLERPQVLAEVLLDFIASTPAGEVPSGWAPVIAPRSRARPVVPEPAS